MLHFFGTIIFIASLDVTEWEKLLLLPKKKIWMIHGKVLLFNILVSQTFLYAFIDIKLHINLVSPLE